MTQDVVRHVLASPVADAGTFVAGYPTNRDAGNYSLAGDHYVRSNKYGTLYNGEDVSFAFGPTGVTITNNTGHALEAQTELWVNLDMMSVDEMLAVADPAVIMKAEPYFIHLGAPDTADADGACASQAINTGTPANINGALASGGVATFDRPRNVVAGWTGTAVMTITGTDAYGEVVVENSASGTSLAGKKAFKTVTRVEVSANVTAATVGTGDVLGLPVKLPGTGCVLKELQDGAPATAGTLVAASSAEATATTGDVRGTYDPNAACDGARVFTLIAALTDPSDKGVGQFAG